MSQQNLGPNDLLNAHNKISYGSKSHYPDVQVALRAVLDAYEGVRQVLERLELQERITRNENSLNRDRARLKELAEQAGNQ